MSDEPAGNGSLVRCAARVVEAADALAPRLGMRRASDVHVEYLELMEAIDDFDAAYARDPIELAERNRGVVEDLAQRLYAAAELIDSYGRSSSADRTHDLIERIAFRAHDVARRLHHLSGS